MENSKLFGEIFSAKREEKKTLSLEAYLNLVIENPNLARSTHQYLYDALISLEGVDEDGIPNYFKRFLFGAERQIKEFMTILKSGASGQDIKRRIILLVGPPGSAKSSFVNLIKRALESYSRTKEGEIYRIKGCPINENPLNAIPDEYREEIFSKYGIKIEQHLCPHCRYRLEHELNGDLSKLEVERFYISEANHTGIGVFVAGEPNTQDASHLIGAIDLGGFQQYKRESHPYAWSWDGALLRGNRGIVELVEMLKAKPELMHYLLTTAQERQVPVDRIGMVDVDTILIAHTNYAEFNKFWKEQKNEAIRDRTRVVIWPYPMAVRDEEKVYDLMLGKLPENTHIAPWTKTLAAGVAILSRLQQRPEGSPFTKLRSLKLWNTKFGENYPINKNDPLVDASAVREDFYVMTKDFPEDGKDGLSPRLIVDWISSALTEHGKCLVPIHLSQYIYAHYVEGQTPVKKQELDQYIQIMLSEYDLYVEKLMQKAFSTSFEEEAEYLWRTYLDHIGAYIRNKKVQNPVTGEWEAPNTTLMEKIEAAAGISKDLAKAFRSEILALVGALATNNEAPKWNSDPRIAKAIEKILMEDRARVMRSTVSAIIPSDEEVNKINAVKKYLIEHEGYCEHCASWILDYYAEKSRRGQG